MSAHDQTQHNVETNYMNESFATQVLCLPLCLIHVESGFIGLGFLLSCWLLLEQECHVLCVSLETRCGFHSMMAKGDRVLG